MIFKAIKQKIHRIRYGSNCKFGTGVELDSKNIFHGMNHIGDYATVLHSELGYATYISSNSFIKNCSIGKFCSIGAHVRIIIGTHPAETFVSTHPSFFSTQKQSGFSFVEENSFVENIYVDKEKRISCIIGNDVWCGENSSILEGIKIGDGAIIGAGAVVTKDVPPFAIVGGVPAKLIRYRFSANDIEALKKIQWWNKSPQWLKQRVDSFKDIKKFLFECEDLKD